MSFVCAFCNLFLPGSGTIVAACFGGETASKVQMSIGFFQFILSFLLIGYIWALWWSYLIIRKATNDEESVLKFVKKDESRKLLQANTEKNLAPRISEMQEVSV